MIALEVISLPLNGDFLYQQENQMSLDSSQSVPAPESFQLLTSIRFDQSLKYQSWNDDQEGPSPFLLLPYHVDRLRTAVELHAWSHDLVAFQDIVNLSRVKAACQQAVLKEDGSCHNAYKVKPVD
jgi:hypothetical protein